MFGVGQLRSHNKSHKKVTILNSNLRLKIQMSLGRSFRTILQSNGWELNSPAMLLLLMNSSGQTDAQGCSESWTILKDRTQRVSFILSVSFSMLVHVFLPLLTGFLDNIVWRLSPKQVTRVTIIIVIYSSDPELYKHMEVSVHMPHGEPAP